MLSIVIPVYNERATLGRALVEAAAALPGVPKEIVVVDDGSKDGTREWLGRAAPDGLRRGGAFGLDAEGELTATPGEEVTLRVILHEKNRGKGGALRTGFGAFTGEIIVIQDADLEYDPADWTTMYDLIVRRGVADAVFGCRFAGLPHRALYYHHYLGNKLISGLFNLLYNQQLVDIEVCTKMFRAEVLRSLRLTSDDFGIEVELCARVARAKRWRIYESPVSYYGRTYAEGKKIRWTDGIKALWYLLRFRFDRLRPVASPPAAGTMTR